MLDTSQGIPSSDSTVRNVITRLYNEVLRDQGATGPAVLTNDTILLESGLDSLGFAILVARLDEELGYDPFSLSDDPFYPQSFGEFVAFYEDHRPE